MNLREEIRRLAEEATVFMNSAGERVYDAKEIGRVESAILAGIKLVLEREPSDMMIAITAGQGVSWDHAAAIYRAMTRELIREIGLFSSPELAYSAYVLAKRRLHPGGML